MLLVATLTVERDKLDAFRSYERSAARIMARHGGAIEQVFVLDEGGPTLREVHVVRFPDEASWARYRSDAAPLSDVRAGCILESHVSRATIAPPYTA